jgi:hypothetical protein
VCASPALLATLTRLGLKTQMNDVVTQDKIYRRKPLQALTANP